MSWSLLHIQGGPHPVYPWEIGVARPLPGVPMLRVNTEIPKPVAPYCPAAGEKVEAEGMAMAAKRSFVVKVAVRTSITRQNARIRSRCW